MATIRDTQRLREIIGIPSDLVAKKFHPQLNARAIEFIGKSPLMMLSTAGATGEATVSPKGDPAGFVHVQDSHTLLIPERKGNKLIFTLQNILENPKIGLVFLVPGTCETLRVQGIAQLVDDAEICERLSVKGARALLAIRVSVTNCYFHCAKAFLRGEIWNPETWPGKMHISFGEEIAEQGGMAAEAAAEFDRGVAQRYKTDLY